MKIIVNPDRRLWHELTARARQQSGEIDTRVAAILDAVRAGGDKAVEELTERIDGVKLASPLVTADEFDEAEAQVPEELKRAIAVASENIRKFHTAQLPAEVEVETMPGVRCVQRAVAINRVGLYVPGGSAPLFSTVLMLALPAKIAGCREIVLCTPPRKDGSVSPVILYAAKLCGVTDVLKIGGAIAIGAMAYGTRTQGCVDKIFGPGNQYVTCAKQQVGSVVAIDMPAGPSEVMVLADGTANPAFVAADLLSQAEHGADSQAMLVCGSRSFAERVDMEIKSQLGNLSRKGTAVQALDNGSLVVMDSPEEIVDFANLYGAEHLIISMENPWDVATRITSAGSVFIGNYTPESAGDYASGTNHTLPTYGWTRSNSGVNIDSFIRKITFQEITPSGLREIGPLVETMAAAEGLDGHENAVRVRLKELG